jgi:hypothetical protein
MSRRKWRLGWLGVLAALSLAESDSGSDSGDSGSSSGDSDSNSGDGISDSGSDNSSGDEFLLDSVTGSSDSSYYSGGPSDGASISGDGPDQNQRKRKRVPGGPGVSVGMSDDDMSDIPGG